VQHLAATHEQRQAALASSGDSCSGAGGRAVVLWPSSPALAVVGGTCMGVAAGMRWVRSFGGGLGPTCAWGSAQVVLVDHGFLATFRMSLSMLMAVWPVGGLLSVLTCEQHGATELRDNRSQAHALCKSGTTNAPHTSWCGGTGGVGAGINHTMSEGIPT